MPSLLYADDVILCSEWEEDLRVIVRRFVEVVRRRGLKFNAGESKVMLLNEEEVLECEVYVDEIRLELVLEFKYFGYVLDESGTDGTECSGKVTSGGRVAGAIRSLVRIGICSLSVLESCIKHCLYLFSCMAARQCYGKRRRDLESGLYKWITSEDC